MADSLRLRMVPGRYGIARLAQDAAVPGWAGGEGFRAVVQADDETTIVCLQERIPDEIESSRDWLCLRTVGPFAFDAAGIVSSLVAPLSAAGIGVFVLCTFDGEHLLVAERDMAQASALLEANGHRFVT
ncbi:ACT domain-containing protein [uncultured Hoeflea sp.]|uniref:ACT domain-containing protein n=1 Tax=uncultured Hoeflea sp. TaxID=538666 RepID=UPI0030D83DE9